MINLYDFWREKEKPFRFKYHFVSNANVNVDNLKCTRLLLRCKINSVT